MAAFKKKTVHFKGFSGALLFSFCLGNTLKPFSRLSHLLSLTLSDQYSLCPAYNFAIRVVLLNDVLSSVKHFSNLLIT